MAQYLESFPLQQRLILWHCVPEDLRGNLLVGLHEEVLTTLTENIEEADLAEMMAELAAEDVADILGTLAEDEQQRLMASMDSLQRERLQKLLSYEEEAVGRYMRTDTIASREDVRLEVVQRYLRITRQLNETT